MRKIEKGQKEFTASVWILTKTNPKKVLLVHHKKFDKWIQPGGHIEKFENPIEAAIREVKEETGLDIGELKDKIRNLENGDLILPVPEFFQEQSIPAYGNEPQHFHLDISYVLEVKEQELKFSKSESHGIGWFSKREVMKLQIHKNSRVILQKIL